MPPAVPELFKRIESEEKYANEITNDTSSRLIMIDVFTDWCGPCKELLPTMKSLQMNTEMFDDRVAVYSIERTVIPALAEQIEATSMPNFLFLKNGVEVEKIRGVNTPKIITTIQENMPALKSDDE
jgi:thiol-disulfide isomerase/thioredoxin